MAAVSGALDEAVGYFEEAVEIRRILGEPVALGHAKHFLGIVWQHQGNHVQAKALLEEAITLYGTPDDPIMATFAALALDQLGSSLAALGDFDRALSLTEEALVRQRELGHPLGVAVGLSYLGEVAWARGDFESALERLREALKVANQLESHAPYVVYFLRCIATVVADQGDVVQAALLAGALEVLREQFGVSDELRFRFAYEEAMTHARLTLGEEAFRSAWDSGRKLSLEQAIAEALTTTSESSLNDAIPLEN